MMQASAAAHCGWAEEREIRSGLRRKITRKIQRVDYGGDAWVKSN